MAGLRRKYNVGGKRLPGGTMRSLGIGGAVEFSGNTHEAGGILLDPQTEVEDGETMDKVSGKDYFFSNHLKVNGRTFAELHKTLLSRNASQTEIEKLAQLQEERSGRAISVIKAEYGGWRKKKQKKETGGNRGKYTPGKLGRKYKTGGKGVTHENEADIREAVKYTGKSQEELMEEFGTNAIPGKYMKYLRKSYEGAHDFVLKPEYLTWDMSNAYGIPYDTETLANIYMESNTGQFDLDNSRYFADEEETGNIKFDDLPSEVQTLIRTYQAGMTPVDFNAEGYKGKKTKKGLEQAIAKQADNEKLAEEKGATTYDSWYQVPEGEVGPIIIDGNVYVISDEGDRWVNEDGTEIEFDQEYLDKEEADRKASANLETEIQKDETGDYTDEEKEIMQKQQILVDAGYDLGDTGPNDDGVDGDWGTLSEAAQEEYDKKQEELKKEDMALESDKYNYSKLDMEEYDTKVREKYNISEEDWNAMSNKDKIAKRDQWADEHYGDKEKEEEALKKQQETDAEYIREANIRSRMPIDESKWATVIVGGKEVQVPYEDRHKYSSIPGQKDSDPAVAGQAYENYLKEQTQLRETAEASSLKEGTYTDDEGNQWQKDAQGRWRVKYMNPSDFGEPTLDEQWTVLTPDMYPGEMNLTPYQEKKSMLQRVNESRSGFDALSLAASAAQLVPAYMAYKEKPDLMDSPGKMNMTDLDRVNYNAERTQNAADYRAISRAIDQSGAGPAGLSNRMMAYNKKQMANMAITAQETKENTRIAHQEAQMNQQAEQTNIKNNMVVDEFNAAAKAATKDRKLEAVQNAMQSLAGMNRDRLQYLASERLADATQGETGVLNRFDLHVKASQISGTTDRTSEAYKAALASLQAMNNPK